MTENLDEQSRSFLQGRNIHDEWLSEYLNPDIDGYYDLAFSQIIEKAEVDSKTELLDAGCGFCHHTVRLARSGAKITAVDFSKSALAAARQTIERNRLAKQVNLEQGDLTALAYPKGAFDVVVCWGVLMHIPDLDKALSEFARVLKPGGKLVLAENNAESLDVKIRERAIVLIKKAVGRYHEKLTLTPRGIEVWKTSDDGGLMVRKANIGYLIAFLKERGVHLADRTAGQFSEAFTNMPIRPLKRAVHAFNQQYFTRNMSPKLALGNILYFRKA